MEPTLAQGHADLQHMGLPLQLLPVSALTSSAAVFSLEEDRDWFLLLL